VNERGCFSLIAVGACLVFYGAACTRERPACAPAALASIEAAYIAEAVEACKGQTFDACTALPGIRDKYRAKRAEWETCK